MHVIAGPKHLLGKIRDNESAGENVEQCNFRGGQLKGDWVIHPTSYHTMVPAWEQFSFMSSGP